MHGWSEDYEKLLQLISNYVKERMEMDPPPLDQSNTSISELHEKVGETITPQGLGGEQALKIFSEELAPRTLSTDHPRFLSFIPAAPTESSSLFDLVVSASSIYGGSWMEGAGAIFAENQTLRYLADLAGYPQGEKTGGVFVSGGTLGNLGALVAARKKRVLEHQNNNLPLPSRWSVVCSEEAHSSLVQVAEVMDVDVIKVAVGDRSETSDIGQLNKTKVTQFIKQLPEEIQKGIFSLVGTAGTTNYGIVDDLDSLGELCQENNWWFHVDGAYGIAGLADPNLKHFFKGIEKSDSFIVDPHKWFFAPFDSCALIYRNLDDARRAHTQRAGYLDILEGSEDNPTDYAVHLTRRVRGLPFWFSLTSHGTEAYREAIQTTMRVAQYAATEITRLNYLELVRKPMLSVVVFRRIGWKNQDYEEWSQSVLDKQIAFVTPSKHKGETVLRFAIVNPKTTEDDIKLILDLL